MRKERGDKPPYALSTLLKKYCVYKCENKFFYKH